MKLTREGKGLLVTGVLVAMAALNTGNNLIYLLTALMLSLAFLDLAAGYRNLRRVSAEVLVKEPVYAGVPVPVLYRFFNEHKSRPAFLVRLFASAVGISPVVPRIDPDSFLEVKDTVVFQKRGRTGLSGASLTSAYPFGFYRNASTLKQSGSFLVYPKLRDVRALLAGVRAITGFGALPHPAGEDFTDIRPYRQGDPMRDVHWKATAKYGGLMVKEFRAGISHRVTVLLDNSVAAAPEVLEMGISLAASIVETLFSEGYPVRLKTLASVSPPARSREQLYYIMDMLALLQPEEADSQLLLEDDGGILLVILCSRGSPLKSLARGAAGVFDAAGV